jgi:mono/diheme cytochrome c family protein
MTTPPPRFQRPPRRPPGAATARCRLAAALLLAAAAQGAALAAPASEATDRGRLLYETHCIACHDTQVHWRDRRLVQDWAGLLVQVRLWQARALLGWTDDDVQAVARHLNERIYRLPAPERRAAGAAPAAATGQRATRW